MPEELRSQVPLLHEMAEAWNIPLVEMAGYEADDIIGTLANKAVEAGMSAYVVTGDRDALQLVKPDLTVLFTKKGISDIVLYDEAKFQEEYQGLSPVQLIDLKGLMGDNSDNIPGVPKVGPKTAMKLIAAYFILRRFPARLCRSGCGIISSRQCCLKSWLPLSWMCLWHIRRQNLPWMPRRVP